MNAAQRLTLLRGGNPRPGEHWADLGCGDGAFTLPLAEVLGSRGSILAVDHDPDALDKLQDALHTLHGRDVARVERRRGELASLSDLPRLDGAIMGNVLHYLAQPARVLATVNDALGPGGRIVLIEYDRADRNQWVPHPIPVSALPGLARAAGIPPFGVVARVASDFGPMVYAAVSRRDKADHSQGATGPR
jgi:ubiquinone/menaquinone biosynthesis C-methylase UbiE